MGSPDRPARDSWYDASSGCVVLVQEPGHNFGMQHSSFLDCNDQVFRDDPNVGCSHDEYGDSYDPMGGGCRHMNGWQKTYQGWHGGCNSVRVTASGTFTLFPLETPCNGIQVLQIRMPKDRPFQRPAGGGGGAGTDTLRYYYLELRTAVGFDTGHDRCADRARPRRGQLPHVEPERASHLAARHEPRDQHQRRHAHGAEARSRIRRAA